MNSLCKSDMTHNSLHVISDSLKAMHRPRVSSLWALYLSSQTMKLRPREAPHTSQSLLGGLSQRQGWALCGWELEMSKEKDSGQGKWPPGLQRGQDPNMEAGAGW